MADYEPLEDVYAKTRAAVLAVARDASRDAILAAVDRAMDAAKFRIRRQPDEPRLPVTRPMPSFGPTPHLPDEVLLTNLAPARGKAASLDAMIDALDRFARHLVFEADCAEYSDARGNCAQYLWAVDILASTEAHVLGLAQPARTA